MYGICRDAIADLSSERIVAHRPLVLIYSTLVLDKKKCFNLFTSNLRKELGSTETFLQISKDNVSLFFPIITSKLYCSIQKNRDIG